MVRDECEYTHGNACSTTKQAQLLSAPFAHVGTTTTALATTQTMAMANRQVLTDSTLTNTCVHVYSPVLEGVRVDVFEAVCVGVCVRLPVPPPLPVRLPVLVGVLVRVTLPVPLTLLL